MGPLGELGALFNPGMRHEIEEELTKKMLREEEGTGRKGRLGIDLDSGVVTIAGDDESATSDTEAPTSESSEDSASLDKDAAAHNQASPHAEASSDNGPFSTAKSQADASATNSPARDRSAVPSGKRHRRR